MIFLKDAASIAAEAALARSSSSLKPSSKVLPLLDPKAALAAAKLRIEQMKARTWRQHLAAAREAVARFVNWLMGIPPGAEALSGMFFVPVRMLSAAGAAAQRCCDKPFNVVTINPCILQP